MLRRFVRIGLVLALLAAPSAFLHAQKSLTLVVDGRAVEVRTMSLSVRQLLARRGIQVGSHDLVRPGLGAHLRDGMIVSIERVVPPIVVTEYTRVEEVPFATVSHFDLDLPVGVSRVVRPGTPGREVVTYRERSRGGTAIDRRAVDARMFLAPVAEFVIIGTHSRERIATWQQGQASWYQRPGVGAAHRWLPKGTRATVTNMETGASITVIIDDRGPYGVPGRVLDLSQEAFTQLAPLGQGVFPVEIQW
ncbi:MAG: G5 domain-containing protein [Actinobacteria bacterium]|nr:G5 domain-containing protein [Actinomycetota bacterium]